MKHNERTLTGKIMKLFFRYLSVVFAVLVLLGTFTACKKDDKSDSYDTIQNDGTINNGVTDDATTDDATTDNGAGDEKENKKIYGNVINMKSFDTTFMSFNILNGSTYDARWDEIASFLMRSGTSVICMQEVKKAQFDFLKEKLADKYEVVWYTRHTADGEGLATAYEKNVWTLVNEECFWLSETPDRISKDWNSKYPRICVRTLLEHKSTGAKLNVFNVHTESNIAQFEQMKVMLERAKKSEYPVLVAGDFNTHYTTHTTVATMETYFQNCQQVARDTDLGITAHDKFKYDDYEGVPIDFCFVSKDIFDVLTFDVCRDRRTDNNSWLSDHYPIKTTVRYIYEYEIEYPDTTPDGVDGEIDG